MLPVQGRVTVPYWKAGTHWTGGRHRGVDLAAAKGTKVVSPWHGKVLGTSWGSAYGTQVIIAFDKLPNGSPGYWGVLAHLSSKKVKAGDRVTAGQEIGKSGATGNVTGPHLHFEIQTAANWRPPSAGNVTRDPQPWLDAKTTISAGDVYLSKLLHNQHDSDSVSRLQTVLNGIKLTGGMNLPITGGYFDQTKAEVSKWQKQKATDKSITDGSRLTLVQARELFAGSKNTVVDDVTVKPPSGGQEMAKARIVYSYSGKPSKAQKIGTGYTAQTDGRFIIPGDGWLFAMSYINLAHTKGKTGGIRHRLVRENPTDETCYSDLAVTKDLVVPGSFLTQPIWFGAAQKNRPMRWDYRRSTSLGEVTAGTRYAKWLWLSAELAAAPPPARSGVGLGSWLPPLPEVLALFAKMLAEDESDEPFQIAIE
jgi:murein DD-endopeptidase MepM/ murein hydrolase activator NlpD